MSLQDKLRGIPSMDRLLAAAKEDEGLRDLPRPVVITVLRQATEDLRNKIRQGTDSDGSPEKLVAYAKRYLALATMSGLKRVVNATGVILHTNMGRAPLSERAQNAVTAVMRGYSNLEYNVETGERGSRHDHVKDKMKELTGAEEVLVVNNNAAAVLLVLSALAPNKEVIISRGQLVEIGGSFRIPDVMKQSGAILVEVGTTNKTHLTDYEEVINENTAAILKVHTSNYRIIGFTAQPADAELVSLAHGHRLPVIEDLGSGTLLPLAAGGWQEPSVVERMAAGVDIVTFSGDKLLGAGQAGIIAGKKMYMDVICKHPLLRALRVDKLSLAALEGTLIDYLYGKPGHDIPVQRMIQMTESELEYKAQQLKERLNPLAAAGWKIDVLYIHSQVGGGSFPGVELPSRGISLVAPDCSEAALEMQLRSYPIPVIARVHDGRLILDVRCITADDMTVIYDACMKALSQGGPV